MDKSVLKVHARRRTCHNLPDCRINNALITSVQWRHTDADITR